MHWPAQSLTAAEALKINTTLFTQQVAVDMEQPGQDETLARPENKHLYLSTTNEI